MFKKIITAVALASTLFLGGCFWGQKVEVPPAFVGVVQTKNGYKPDLIPPSIFRLDTCWAPGAICDKLVLIDQSDRGRVENFQLFMPLDQLNVSFDLRMTTSIKDDNVRTILSKLTPVRAEGLDGRVILQDVVYETYAQPIIRDAVRAVMADFSIDEILSSRDAVNAKIRERVNTALENTPIGLKQAGLADVQYPKVITDKKEQAKQNEIEIEQEEARKQVSLIKLETELETAKARRAIRRENAQAAAEENQIAAQSVTPEYLEYKKLEVMELMATNKNAVFLPFNALDEVGTSQLMFNNGTNTVKEAQ